MINWRILPDFFSVFSSLFRLSMPPRVSSESPLKVSVKAAAETRHLPACQRFFYYSTCSVSALTQHSAEVIFSFIYLLTTVLLAWYSPQERKRRGKLLENYVCCVCEHVCSNLGHAYWAGINLSDALIGFVSSLPHPIILWGSGKGIKFKYCKTLAKWIQEFKDTIYR